MNQIFQHHGSNGDDLKWNWSPLARAMLLKYPRRSYTPIKHYLYLSPAELQERVAENFEEGTPGLIDAQRELAGRVIKFGDSDSDVLYLGIYNFETGVDYYDEDLYLGGVWQNIGDFSARDEGFNINLAGRCYDGNILIRDAMTYIERVCFMNSIRKEFKKSPIIRRGEVHSTNDIRQGAQRLLNKAGKYLINTGWKIVEHISDQWTSVWHNRDAYIRLSIFMNTSNDTIEYFLSASDSRFTGMTLFLENFESIMSDPAMESN